MQQLIYIFLGGGLGSVVRYLLGQWISNKFVTLFPLGTFTINILGSLCIGFLFVYLSKFEYAKLFLIIGFCGGFTTFSTFSADAIQLIRNNQPIIAFFYIFSSVLVSLLFTAISYFITSKYIH